MKRTYKITGYSSDRNADGTLKGKVRVRILLDLDGGAVDEFVVKAMDGTEETITGKLATHIATQATRETDFTVTEDDIEVI